MRIATLPASPLILERHRQTLVFLALTDFQARSSYSNIPIQFDFFPIPTLVSEIDDFFKSRFKPKGAAIAWITESITVDYIIDEISDVVDIGLATDVKAICQRPDIIVDWGGLKWLYK